MFRRTFLALPVFAALPKVQAKPQNPHSVIYVAAIRINLITWERLNRPLYVTVALHNPNTPVALVAARPSVTEVVVATNPGHMPLRIGIDAETQKLHGGIDSFENNAHFAAIGDGITYNAPAFPAYHYLASKNSWLHVSRGERHAHNDIVTIWRFRPENL